MESSFRKGRTVQRGVDKWLSFIPWGHSLVWAELRTRDGLQHRPPARVGQGTEKLENSQWSCGAALLTTGMLGVSHS